MITSYGEVLTNHPTWQDMTKDQRLLCLFMLLKTNSAGVFKSTERKLSFETELDSGKILKELEGIKLILHDPKTSEVWFREYMRNHNPITGAPQFRAKFNYDSNEVESKEIKDSIRSLWKEMHEFNKRVNLKNG